MMNMYLEKFHVMGRRFESLVKEKKYAEAKYIYDTAMRVSVFLQLSENEMELLYGKYGEEDHKAIFRREYVDLVDRYCCITANRGYQDMACRRSGEPVRYYSDDDFCARCKKRAVPGRTTL